MYFPHISSKYFPIYHPKYFPHIYSWHKYSPNIILYILSINILGKNILTQDYKPAPKCCGKHLCTFFVLKCGNKGLGLTMINLRAIPISIYSQTMSFKQSWDDGVQFGQLLIIIICCKPTNSKSTLNFGQNTPYSKRRDNQKLFLKLLLAPQSGAHTIAPHRDPNPNPTHPIHL